MGLTYMMLSIGVRCGSMDLTGRLAALAPKGAETSLRCANPRGCGERPAAGSRREPSNAIEHMIAAIWAQVLDLDGVRATDRFIDLGGDTLQAGRVAAGITSTFGVEIDLISLLVAETVEEMASAVNAALAKRTAATRLRS